MSYRKAYYNRGMSDLTRFQQRALDEASLDDQNILADTVNYEGMEVAMKPSQQTPNINVSPSPNGTNTFDFSTMKRIRLMGPLDIYPDENNLDNPEHTVIRRDFDGVYNCGVPTEEVAPSQPGAMFDMKAFGNDPAYNGSKQNLRFQAPSSLNAFNQQALMFSGGGNFQIADMNWANGEPVATKPRKGKAHPYQAALTDDTQIPGAFIPATTRVTSPYGMRTITVNGKTTTRLHKGIDFAGGKRSASGLRPKQVATNPQHIEPCFSAFDGVVTVAKIEGRIPSDTGYGPVLYIEHQVKDKGGNDRTIQTRYGHLEYTELKKGDTVTKGQIVGHIGSQGGSTGPHLHFEVRENNKAFDPMIVFGWAFGEEDPQPPAEGVAENDSPQEDNDGEDA